MSTRLIHPFRWLVLALALAFRPRLRERRRSVGKPFSNEQLDQMTAQVALYPDSLLAQVLMATTYPDEFAKAAEWSKAHPDAKGDDAVKMVENEPWDPCVRRWSLSRRWSSRSARSPTG